MIQLNIHQCHVDDLADKFQISSPAYKLLLHYDYVA